MPSFVHNSTSTQLYLNPTPTQLNFNSTKPQLKLTPTQVTPINPNSNKPQLNLTVSQLNPISTQPQLSATPTKFQFDLISTSTTTSASLQPPAQINPSFNNLNSTTTQYGYDIKATQSCSH